MIKFTNLSNDKPYVLFKDLYDRSMSAGQKNIEAICIASYSKHTNEAQARFVNLKFVDNKNFIFFSNYNSLKAKDFNSHNQITGLIYWNSINVQIRIKALIKKTKKNFNKKYFLTRGLNKNALAISSNQSQPVKSYEEVIKNYEKIISGKNLKDCPDYWGGYIFTPYYFEFWSGHESRLNKREIYKLDNDNWIKSYLQP